MTIERDRNGRQLRLVAANTALAEPRPITKTELRIIEAIERRLARKRRLLRIQRSGDPKNRMREHVVGALEELRELTDGSRPDVEHQLSRTLDVIDTQVRA